MVWDWEWKEIFNLSLQRTSIWTTMCLLWRRARQVRTGKKCSTGPCKGHRYRQQWVSFEGDPGGGHQSRNGKKCSCKGHRYWQQCKRVNHLGDVADNEEGTIRDRQPIFFFQRISTTFIQCVQRKGGSVVFISQPGKERSPERSFWNGLHFEREPGNGKLKETGNSP